MKNNPTISVVMPVFNGVKYLGEAIESILKQTYPDFEFLIINDGSTDESEEIIRSYSDPRIVYLRNDRNQGLVYTLNYGISLAKGEFIARMDADDISLPDRFFEQINIFNQYSEIGLCGTHAKFFGSANLIVTLPIKHKQILTYMLFENPIIHSSAMFRAEIFSELKIRYDSSFLHAEDYELWFRLSKLTKLQNLKNCLTKYRVHEASISNSNTEVQQLFVNQIRIKALEYFLNINASDEEIKLHLELINGSMKSYDDKKIQLWVNKIIKRNIELKQLDTHQLKKLLSIRWLILLKRYNGEKDNIIEKIKRCRRYISLKFHIYYINLRAFPSN